MAYKANAQRWVGHPVCLLLKDGSYYIGTLQEAKEGYLTLSEARMFNKEYESEIRANTSGFLESMFGSNGGSQLPFGNQGVAPGTANNSGGFFNMFSKAWPMISIGMNMVRTIWPLLSMFKI